MWGRSMRRWKPRTWKAFECAEGLRPCSEGDEESVQSQDLHCSEVHLELKRLEESTRDISTGGGRGLDHSNGRVEKNCTCV